ncbi:hypothetical protein MSAN_01968800 [Mycena sanguinolenta]|uniref:Uncharacterized protein n=1 Tax=Mycena sanguinolenta TaxID=230812 RepID=A0A8H6XLJ7_9AGAR|nr:hypothetical protein MSAN_01968800 [Mycena sanguinolenta]
MPALSRSDPLFGLIYYVLGGWFIGSSFVMLLEGILITQACSFVGNYYAWYTDDSLRIKITVAGLFFLTVLKTIQSFAITWINSILYMQDPAGTVALEKDWYQVINIPLGALIAAYVQTYYCYRFGDGFNSPKASVIARSGKSSNWFAAHVSCTFATDLLITGASTFFLLKAREKAHSHTRKLISGLIKICCQTALPATAATLLELICSRIGGKSLKLQATNSIVLVLLDTIPIIYAFVSTPLFLKTYAQRPPRLLQDWEIATPTTPVEVAVERLDSGIRLGQSNCLPSAESRYTQIETAHSAYGDFDSKKGPDVL